MGQEIKKGGDLGGWVTTGPQSWTSAYSPPLSLETAQGSKEPN